MSAREPGDEFAQFLTDFGLRIYAARALMVSRS